MSKAIILFSGGIDSTVMLALAKSRKLDCVALSFDYGQRHRIELKHAAKIAKHYSVPQLIINLDPKAFGNAAMVNEDEVPHNRSGDEIASSGIPNTYVPARNTLFLSFALAQAELLKAKEIHFGANALDCVPYPDCRPEFIKAYQELINTATQQSVEGNPPQIVAPLIEWNKKKIIQKGLELKAPLDMTFSCYNPSKEDVACETCDACMLRNEGFRKFNS
jgi:7-cyano-7-deazaguanine synthase